MTASNHPTHLTTHVLDAAAGTPAVAVTVTLTMLQPGAAQPVSAAHLVATAITDSDGRAALGPEELAPGNYTLTFDTGSHFAAQGVAAFFPFVAVSFTVVAEPDGSRRHYHVPLLLSPFAYSTYRGS